MVDRCPHCNRLIGPGEERFAHAPERDREAELAKRTRRRALDVSLVDGPDGRPAIRFDKPAPEFDEG